MKLSSITIQGMHHVQRKTYDLSGFHYFYGENGAGKSTILQAIQLSLLGYIPGTDKTKTAIFQHANCPEMSVSLTLTENEKPIIISRVWKKKGKTITSNCNVYPATYDVDSLTAALDLPICNFSEFLGMSANKQKDWFMHFLPAQEDVIDWDKLLRESIADFGKILDTDFVAEAIQFTREMPSANGIEGVRAFNAYLKEQQSAWKAELSRLQSTVQSLIYYSDCSDDSDLECLKSNLQTAQLLLDSWNTKKLKLQQNQRLESEIAKLPKEITEQYCSGKSLEENLISNPSYLEYQQKTDAMNTQLSLLNSTLHEQRENLDRIHRRISEMQDILGSGGICPYTKLHCPSITEQISLLQVQESDCKKDYETVQSDISDTEAGIQKLTESISYYKEQMEKLRQQYLTFSAIQQQYHTDVADLTVEQAEGEIAKQKAMIQNLQDTMIKIEANRKYEALTAHLTNDKYRIEQNLEILKVWIKLTDVNGLQSKITEAPFRSLEKKMSVYLQKFFADTHKFTSAKFHLEEKANSFSFGVLNTDGEYIAYELLSSGEKCLYALTLMLSILEISKSPLKLILIDDLLDHLDSDRVHDCFETLYGIDTVQIILAGVQPSNSEKAVKIERESL